MKKKMLKEANSGAMKDILLQLASKSDAEIKNMLVRLMNRYKEFKDADVSRQDIQAAQVAYEDGSRGKMVNALIKAYLNGRHLDLQAKANSFMAEGKFMDKIKDGVHDFLNQGYPEGKPEKIRDVITGNGWTIKQVVEKAPDHMIFNVNVNHDMPLMRQLSPNGGSISFEDLVKDLNTFFYENGKRMHAAEDEEATDRIGGKGWFLRIERETIDGAEDSPAENTPLNEQAQAIAKLVANSAKRALQEMKLAHDMDRYSFNDMVNGENEAPEDTDDGKYANISDEEQEAFENWKNELPDDVPSDSEEDDYFNSMSEERPDFEDPLVAESVKKIASILVSEIKKQRRK